MRMVWATITEVREYLGHRLPSTVTDDQVDKLITKAVRSLSPKVLRIPPLDEQDRPADEDVKGHVVAAVGEVVAARRAEEQTDGTLGAMSDVLEHGGSITAGSLTVDGPARGKQTGYGRGRLLPFAAVEALQAAHMVGGSVPAW